MDLETRQNLGASTILIRAVLSTPLSCCCDFAIFPDQVSSELICQSPIMGDTFDPSLCFRHGFTKLA
jgi:hypothetical protein